MVEIDMNKEPDSGFLFGTNLWEVVKISSDKSRNSGERMLRIKLRCGEIELDDIAMLGGKGWGIGKNKLIALGVDPTFQGNLDVTELIGRKVWVATVKGRFEGLDRNTGEKKWFDKCEVDINALRCSGYQPEAEVPHGVVVPTGPDDTPF